MLLTELKKVIEIDGRISRLHRELTALYEERANYVQSPNHTISLQTDGGVVSEGTTAKISPELWSEQQHTDLKKIWSSYHLAIPTLAQLKPRLLNAHAAIEALEKSDNNFKNNLVVLLVPPSKELSPARLKHFRAAQAFISIDDYINPELMTDDNHRNWRVIVVFNEPIALNWGSAKNILTKKKYLIAGYDTRALGLSEHLAFSLQNSQPVDKDTWTSLLKDCQADTELVASVTFFKGQYRYEIDDVEGIFGDERYRPAIEIAE